MDATLALLLTVVAVVAGLSIAAYLMARPKRLDTEYFNERWQDAQKLCNNKDTWPLAIINADKLVDEALRRRHFKGKTMGERLVAAQKTFSDNDGVWHGHKLRNKLVHEDIANLKEADVKKALVGFRQALKDMGAI